MLFELRDVLLAALAGFLFGILLLGQRPGRPRSRPFARLLGMVLEPIMFWADLRGPDGRPSLSKIAYFITLVVALWGLIDFGHQQTEGLDAGFIAYAILVLAYALGKQVFNTALQFIVARFPGAGERIQRLSNGHEIPCPPEPPGLEGESPCVDEGER